MAKRKKKEREMQDKEDEKILRQIESQEQKAAMAKINSNEASPIKDNIEIRDSPGLNISTINKNASKVSLNQYQPKFRSD